MEHLHKEHFVYNKRAGADSPRRSQPGWDGCAFIYLPNFASNCDNKTTRAGTHVRFFPRRCNPLGASAHSHRRFSRENVCDPVCLFSPSPGKATKGQTLPAGAGATACCTYMCERVRERKDALRLVWRGSGAHTTRARPASLMHSGRDVFCAAALWSHEFSMRIRPQWTKKEFTVEGSSR